MSEKEKMLPAGPLMKEHRLIERMIKLVSKEIKNIEKTGKTEAAFIDKVINFIRTYADKCHHGKEEDILFSALSDKNMKPEHDRIMDELLNEHVYGRKTIKLLSQAKEKYAGGDEEALGDIQARLKDLEELYPNHIDKEDNHFFLPVMEYFSRQEQDEMLADFAEFDKQMIHKAYKSIVEALEENM